MPNDLEIQGSLKDKFDALPDEFKTAMTAVDLPTLIYEIGKKHGLAIDKIGVLGDVVNEFVNGFIAAKDFTKELVERINIEEDASRAVAIEINRAVFRPIRESLKKATSQPPPAAQLPKTPPPPTTKQIIPPPHEPKVVPPPPAPTVKPAMPPPITSQPPPPPSPKTIAYATPKPPQERKPEPLIIRPLQSARRETPPEIPDIFKPAPAPIRPSIPTPKPTEPKPPAPMSAPRPPQAAPMAARETVPAETKPIEEKTGVRDQALSASEEKPAPIISPLGLSPAAPMPPKAIYEKAKDTFNKELKEFRKDETAKETNIAEAAKEGESLTPSLLPAGMITKEELQKEIEKFRGQGTRDQALGAGPAEEQKPSAIQPTQPKPAATPKTAVQPSPPLKLPQQKIPKPPAPEKYEEDPYREPQE